MVVLQGMVIYLKVGEWKRKHPLGRGLLRQPSAWQDLACHLASTRRLFQHYHCIRHLHRGLQDGEWVRAGRFFVDIGSYPTDGPSSGLGGRRARQRCRCLRERTRVEEANKAKVVTDGGGQEPVERSEIVKRRAKCVSKPVGA